MGKKNKFLKLGTRHDIYQFIDENPGVHVREIARKLDISRGSVRHHIKQLKKYDLIEERFDYNYKRIYPKNKISSIEKDLLKLLRQEVPRRIFIYLLFSISFSQKELSQEMELSPNTINFHLQKLLKIGVIEKADVENGVILANKDISYKMYKQSKGPEIFYRRKDSKLIEIGYKLLTENKESFSDKAIIDSYVHYLEELDWKPGNDRLNNKLGKRKKDYIAQFFDNFPMLLKPPFAY